MSVEQKHKERTRFRVKKEPNPVAKAAKYRALLIGGFLIVIGVGSLIYMLDYKPDLSSISDISNIKDLLSLWPLWITLLGFLFIIYDYFKNSSKEKYK